MPIVSTFSAVKAPVPTHVGEIDWDFLAAELGKFADKPKNQVELWSPTQFDPGVPRSKRTARALSCIVADLDGISNGDLKRVLDRLKAGPWPFAVCTSASHMRWEEPKDGAQKYNGTPRVRVVLPLAEQVPAGRWPSVAPRVNEFFFGLCDPAALNDVARVYYESTRPTGPFKPGAAPAEPLFLARTTGPCIEVDDLPSSAEARKRLAMFSGKVKKKRRNEGIVSIAGLAELASEYRAKRSDMDREIGRRIKALIEGKAFAKHGDQDELGGRDITAYRLSGIFARRWPDSSAEQIAGVFERSLSAMGTDTKLTAELILPKAERHLAAAREAREEAAGAQEAALRERIINAYRGTEKWGTDEAYKGDEIAQWGGQRLRTRWIIRKGPAHYVFLHGDYLGPYQEKELVAKARDLLAPAEPWGVTVFDEFDGVEYRNPKTPAQLVLEYGSVADNVVGRMGEPVSWFDEEASTLNVAKAPQRVFEAKFDKDVHGWLESFGDPALLAWVACVPRINKPIPALFLNGPPDIGKSLLTRGLSQLWTTGGATSAEEYVSTWNTGIMNCPLVVADESIPRELTSARLRRLVQDETQEVRQKFMDSLTVHGCLRLMITTNNHKVLDFDENLTINDVNAIASRFLVVRPDDAPARYLAALGGRPGVADFVTGDRIAKHALWLAENHTDGIDESERFLLPPSQEMIERLRLTSGNIPRIMGWISRWILDGGAILRSMVKADFLRADGQEQTLAVSTHVVSQYWRDYSNARQPREEHIRAGLSLLGLGKRGRKGEHMITYETVRRWCEVTGLNDWAVLEDGLKTMTDGADIA